MNRFFTLLACLPFGLCSAALSFEAAAEDSTIWMSPVKSAPTGIIMSGAALVKIQTGALYPEGLEYNPVTGKFLLGSFREGVIYEVDGDGRYTPLVKDERLVSLLGIRVDAMRNRLLVAVSDLGVSARKSAVGTNKFAALGIYELSSGKNLQFVNLDTLRPAGESHIANDLAIDADGNAYITDSLAPVIYRVDVRGMASVFLESNDKFNGQGVNLNGIVWHPKGYLIVVKKSDGALFKVPLDAPEKFSKIATARSFVGGDGLVLTGENDLVVIANRVGNEISNTAFAIRSDDGWTSGLVGGEFKFASDDYPTTGAVKNGQIYVTEGKLNRLIADEPSEKASGFARPATIQQVGTVVP